MSHPDQPYHAGELAVQARAGVRGEAARLAGIVRDAMPPRTDAFLAGQRLVVLGSVDASGRVWASLLTGSAGMLRAPDPHTLRIDARPVGGDPLQDLVGLAESRRGELEIGALVIDLATRRRLRLNGRLEPVPGDGLRLHVRQAYWNCPKYIQERVVLRGFTEPVPPRTAGPVSRAARLGDAQRALIERADTFFVASAHPVGGVDASHRGGEPGFVRVERSPVGDDVISFPDYSGNNMFNTLGNLAANPPVGLLFVDFDRGTTLQLTGSAEILWEQREFGRWPGAERAVRVVVREVVEVAHATPLHWMLVETSPFNPPARARSE